MNTKPRKNAKKNLDKYSFKLTNITVFGKSMENKQNHRVIKLVTNDARKNFLVSEPNYHIFQKIYYPEKWKKHKYL